MEKIIILDSNSLMNKAFFALPRMTTIDGLNTNAIVGFLNMLLKLKAEYGDIVYIAAFDKSKTTFRNEQYKDYKSNRKGMLDDLREQFPHIKNILNLMKIPVIEIAGFEGDDIIGTLTKKYDSDHEIIVVTGDRDALQLASKNTKIMISKKGVAERDIYDEDAVVSAFGVTPLEFIDVKALWGDASDNIPGVSGIGEKTAFKLITQYKSIENIYESLDNFPGGKIKENLINGMEDAFLSKKLATIYRDIELDYDDLNLFKKEKPDNNELREYLLKLELKSLVDKIAKETKENISLNIEAKEIVDLKEIKDLSIGDFDLFLNYDYSYNQYHSSISIKHFVIKIKDKLFYLNGENLEFYEYINSVKDRLIVFDAKPLYSFLKFKGINLKNIKFDIKLANYLLDPNRGEETLSTLIKLRGFSINLEDELKTLIDSTFYMDSVFDFINKRIEELNLVELLYDIEQPATKVLSDMETAGFKINKDQLEIMGNILNEDIKETEKKIYDICDEEFNIASPKQLGKILFEKLDLPVIKTTKTGYSTNAEVLDALKDKHEVIDKIIYYRGITKLHSTYIEGLKPLIDENGRIHTSFNQTITATGRLSSTEPNLQNIPIKSEQGKGLRKFFEADEASLILSADYSQIELRVLAHISNDEKMIKAYKENIDIHRITASEVLNIPLDEVSEKDRNSAKAINFGIVYGISDYALSESLGIAKKKAKEYIDSYFKRYPKVKQYLDNTVEQAKKDGYVKTIFNRIRYIPEIKNTNKVTKALGERLAMNSPIQGSAADIIKIAMVKVYNKLMENSLKSYIVLQVHDELILNVFEEEFKIVSNLVKYEMENAVFLNVPLEVHISSGKNWYDAK
ncbi:MAG: DNA polymerase I [Oscillospiraceae bacterium]|nr:DNA polymerase I [Oscillospiraceae bacterium]